jgi:Co/Zn/Cd efflux system component
MLLLLLDSWNETLESQVLNGLMLVVPSLGVLMLLIGSWIFQKSKKESNQFFILLGRGLLGWVLGGIGFHIILILFGAPFYE